MSACTGVALVARVLWEVSQVQASASLAAIETGGVLRLALSVALLIASAPLLGFAWAEARTPRADKFDLSNFIQSHVTFNATVSADLSKSESPYRRYLISLQSLEAPYKKALHGRALLVVHPSRSSLPPSSESLASLPVGSHFRASALIRSIEPASFPWEFDNRTHMSRMGAFCAALTKPEDLSMEEVPASDYTSRFTIELDGMRQFIRNMHCRVLGEENGSLLASMVLGDRAVKLSRQLSKDFREVGLSHLLAASGFNLTVVIGTTYWMFRCIPSQTILCLIGHAATLTFVALAGPSPSVIRAALMCSMVLLSRCFFRHLHSFAALCVAMLITVVMDPLTVVDLGCQLSYVAAAGIICGASALSRVVAGCFRSAGGWLWETVAVIFIAQAAILPVQLYYFWQTGLLFLPANLVVTPLIAPVTVIGFVGSLGAIVAAIVHDTSFVTGVTSLVIRLAGVPLDFIVFVVRSMASVTAARVMLGPPLLPSIWFYYFALIVLLAVLRQHAVSASSVVCASIVFLASCYFLVARSNLSEPIVFCLPQRILLVDRDRSYVSVRSEGGSAIRKDGPVNSEDGSGNREDGSGSRGDGSGSREDGSGSRGDGSGSRGDGSASREDGSGSREDGSGSREDGSGSREDGSASREDGSASSEHGSVSRQNGERRKNEAHSQRRQLRAGANEDSDAEATRFLAFFAAHPASGCSSISPGMQLLSRCLPGDENVGSCSWRPRDVSGTELKVRVRDKNSQTNDSDVLRLELRRVGRICSRRLSPARLRFSAASIHSGSNSPSASECLHRAEMRSGNRIKIRALLRADGYERQARLERRSSREIAVQDFSGTPCCRIFCCQKLRF